MSSYLEESQFECLFQVTMSSYASYMGFLELVVCTITYTYNVGSYTATMQVDTVVCGAESNKEN